MEFDILSIRISKMKHEKQNVFGRRVELLISVMSHEYKKELKSRLLDSSCVSWVNMFPGSNYIYYLKTNILVYWVPLSYYATYVTWGISFDETEASFDASISTRKYPILHR